MARLPQPGGDSGNWGDILNDYLSQAHKTDGSLEDNSVTASTIAPGAVTKADVGLSDVNNTADTAKPISTAQQSAFDLKADTSALATKLNTADLDAQTAAKITTDGTATQGALSATYVSRALATNGAAFGASIPNSKKADGTTTATWTGLQRILCITKPRTGAALGVMYGTDEVNGPVRRSIDVGETFPYGSSNTRPPSAGITQVIDYVEWLATDRLYSFNAADNKVYSTTISVNATDPTWTEETGLTLTSGATIFGQGLCATDWATGANYMFAAEYGNPGPTGGPTLWRRPTTGGASQAWTAVLGPLATFKHMHCVAADPDNPGHVYLTMGDGLANQVRRSTDYGDTWTSLTADPAIQACQISFTDGFVWFAADAGGPTAFVYDRADGVMKHATYGSHKNIVNPSGPVIKAITTKALTSNVATLTTLTTHGFVIGTNPLFPVYATVVGVDSTFDGTYVVTSAPTTTTFTYAKTATNVTSVAATGTMSTPNPFRKQAYVGIVDPATGFYYGMATQDDNAPTKTGLFIIPEAGGSMFLLDGNDSNDNEPNSTPMRIANGWVYFGRRRIKLVTR